MTPTIDERLASIIRALSDVILPALPPEASLAQEQAQLSIGHLSILRAQLDATPAFEAEEYADAVRLGQALVKAAQGGDVTKTAGAALSAALRRADGDRAGRIGIHAAIADLIAAIAIDGKERARASVRQLVLAHETARAAKERRWFAPFGFDAP